MAAKNVPWWRKAIQFVAKSIQAIVRFDLRNRAVVDQAESNESDTDASHQQKAAKEETLTGNSPNSVPQSEPVAALPEKEITAATPAAVASLEPETAVALEAVADSPEASADLSAESVVEALPVQQQPEIEGVAPDQIVEVVAEVASEQVEEHETATVMESSSDAEGIADDVEKSTEEAEVPAIEAVEAASEPDVEEVPKEEAAAAQPEAVETEAASPSEEKVEEDLSAAAPEMPVENSNQNEPPFPAEAIEQTVLAPEIETDAIASEPDLDVALETAAAEESATEDAPAEPEAEVEVEAVELTPMPDEPIEETAQNEPEVEVPAEAAPEEAVSAAEPVIDEAAPQQVESESAPEEDKQTAQPEAVAAAIPSAPATPPAKPVAPAKEPPQPIKREEGPENSPFSVIVSQVYEGPMDLLLDLIRKQDIDIYNIPIAKITAQFLAYVNHLRASDMDVAGEFIYTASLLIHIKSKMLLPREPSGLDDAQEDPRRELVERLLEHERFKNAAQMLQQKQMLEAATWSNPGAREFVDDVSAEPEIAADTVDLVRIFRDILDRARNRPILNLEEDTVTVGQMIQFLSRRLTMEDKPVALRRLLSHTKSERALIAMFLALLELVRLQAILLRQDLHFSEIFIKKNSGFDAVMEQGLIRDDWQ
jgi:segregation and condensation protein A